MQNEKFRPGNKVRCKQNAVDRSLELGLSEALPSLAPICRAEQSLIFRPCEQSAIASEIRCKDQAENGLEFPRQIDLAPRTTSVGASEDSALRAYEKRLIAGKIGRNG